ncbi:MAG TPA: regulatory protein RecX [Thermoanaerobaculia bacterium]|nr:regulatory protein RecX [Thermoanaerobaculia bacterium]
MAERPTAYRKAQDLLARRGHFRAELAAKLRQRGYEQEEVAATLDRLAEQGWLDDRQAARDFLRSRLARGPEGRRKLAHELARRGAADEVIAEAMADLLPEDEAATAVRAAERWLARGGDPADRAALARHLERKGFAGGAIRGALERV